MTGTTGSRDVIPDDGYVGLTHAQESTGADYDTDDLTVLVENQVTHQAHIFII
jgi:hypothetical protein